MLVKKETLKECEDCNVIPGKSVVTQHRIMIVDIFVKKVNESVNWCTDKEVNYVRDEVTGIIQIIVEEVLGGSRERMMMIKIHGNRIEKWRR